MQVRFENLTKVFPKKSKQEKDVIAVNDFDFTIPDGKLVALLGPSGCGKSTCLNLICGLLEPSKGKLFFGENDVTKLPPENRGVGMVFQNYALYPHLTVKENIAFPLGNLKGKDKLSKQETEKRILDAAKLVSIENLMDRKPKELSGGQQQRVAIARSLVKMPKVLLLDEPLSNLDARLRLQTREQIRKIQLKTGITTIFVTHDQEEAMSISDLIILMKDGQIQQIGKPQEVYENPCNLFVAKFLGTPAINVFKGYIKDKKIYIGKNVIGTTKLKNQKVTIGIRPEGLDPSARGKFECSFKRLEIMGRDHSIVCENENSISENAIRAIIDSEIKINEKASKIKFNISKTKMYIFDIENGNRIQ